MTYIAGNIVVLTNTLTNNGTPIDPTSISLKIKDPAGTITTITTGITHSGTGVYTYNLDTTGGAPGIWTYEWVSTGSAQAVSFGQFLVYADPV